FRDRLEAGSGFQSSQFRELEFALGWKDPKALERYPAGSEVRRRLERRLKSASLWDSFLRHLASSGVPVPPTDLDRDVTRRVEPSPALREALVTVYRTQPALAELCERLVDLDEGIMEWRYRHLKMVQRTIGTRRGTGGSTGADYLLATLNRPLFPDLWAIRTEL
nr:tryptophan 2,3-dioxygenase [Gemmatimonadales bacterium]